MIIRQVDGASDWSFGKGLSDFAIDDQAISQNIRSRVLSWLNDCFFALTDGVDWRSRLDVGQEALLVEEIKAVILKSFGVVGINKVTVDLDKTLRHSIIKYDVSTIFSRTFQQVIQQSIGN